MVEVVLRRLELSAFLDLSYLSSYSFGLKDLRILAIFYGSKFLNFDLSLG